MATSTARTIVLPSRLQNTYGTLPAPFAFQWPMAEPEDNLDYSVDATARFAEVNDSIATVSLSINPSGTGELQALDLAVQGSVITAQLTGGVAGRNYAIKVVATGISGRVFTWKVGLSINNEFASWPVPKPPVAGFGTPITWTSGATVFGPAFVAVATGLTATGNNQATAAPLSAQTNIFATVPAGTGAVLPSEIVSGTFTVTNAGVNDLLVYPPGTAQVGSSGAGVAVALSPNQTVSFSTQNPTSQWYAQ